MAICCKVQLCKELLNTEELFQLFKPTNYYDFQLTPHFVTDFFSFLLNIMQFPKEEKP